MHNLKLKKAEMIAQLNTQSSYSKIISPEKYNEIISQQHLYIADSDQYIFNLIREEIKKLNQPEIVELGCGPGRLFHLAATLKNANFTAIDIDEDFLDYAKKIDNDFHVNIILADITTYNLGKPIDIFYSQGMHHHITKGNIADKYLKNIYQQLKPGGCYVLSDEFIPDYDDESERTIKLIIWYSHIITNALKSNFLYLAQEEAKTLWDDLHEGTNVPVYKTEQQIDLILTNAYSINLVAMANDLELARTRAMELLTDLKTKNALLPGGDNALDLSRGDYKICDRVLRNEVEKAGFTIEDKKLFSTNRNIGGMCVYTLRKE